MRRTQPIFDLTFAERWRHRPFSIVAEGFVEDSWEVTAERISSLGPVAPFVGVEVEVDDPARRGSDCPVVFGGLASRSPGLPDLFASYEPARRRVTILAREQGRTTVLARAALGRWRGPARTGVSALGFALCENQVTVLLRSDGPEQRWRPVLTERAQVAAWVDLRDPAALAHYRYAAGAPGAAEGSGAHARAGVFGMAGLRDPHLVQHSDGRPYRDGGAMFVTFTCAGLGFFAQAHWGVFRFDPAAPERFEQVSQIFFRRDGRVLGDHAGQLVWDEDARCWEVGVSSWGDFDGEGVHVRRAHSSADLLSGVHVLDSEPVAMPTAVSCWDPGMTRIEGRWHVSFVESSSQRPFVFHPALAVGAGSTWAEDLQLRGAASELSRCEGPVLARLEGDWWLLASDGRSRTYPVFDLDLRQVGRLRAPYGSNIPHPQVVQREDGSWLLLTFDGTSRSLRVTGYGAHGEVVVLVAGRNASGKLGVPSGET